MALTNKLTAIADAIRSKTGKTNKLSLDEMATEITSIESGGSGETPSDSSLKKYFRDELFEFSDESLTEITRDNAFSNLYNLEKVDIPNLRKVGINFLKNSGIKHINFPKLTYSKDSYIANGCENLETCYLPNLYEFANNSNSLIFQNCKKLRDINIDLIEKLSNGSFDGCESLPLLNLKSVKEINSISYAPTFRSCNKLVTLILRNAEVVLLTDSKSLFSYCPINNGGYKGLEGYIYVPKALLDDYKVATNWSVYAEKFRAIEDYPEICGEVS